MKRTGESGGVGTPLIGPAHWPWPPDDSQPVDLSPYYSTTYAKHGLSKVMAARLVDDTPAAWQRRRQAPIAYLVKFGRDAVAERCYYRLARELNLAQQHVFWGMYPTDPRVIAAAIRFEPGAFFPRVIDALAGTVTYRRRLIHVDNALDHIRHHVLHLYCGSDENSNQAMVRGRLLFGIDAAACSPRIKQSIDFWLWALGEFRAQAPAGVPTVLEMMARIAAHTGLADLVERELAVAPYPALLMQHFAPYGQTLRVNQASLQRVLEMQGSL